MSEEFYIGQIFEGEYPPEAACYCNDHGDRYIEEIEPTAEGVRRFEIKAVPEPTTEEIAAGVRMERDMLIGQTDYLAMPDYPLTDDEREALTQYRQALRDLPQAEGFPTAMEWPSVPVILNGKGVRGHV